MSNGQVPDERHFGVTGAFRTLSAKERLNGMNVRKNEVPLSGKTACYSVLIGRALARHNDREVKT